METLFGAVSAVSDAVWGPLTIALLLGTGLFLVLLGATASVELVWAWGDLTKGLQIFPDLVGLIGLSALVAAMLKGGRSAT